MNPFLTKYQNDFISASRSGGSFCIVLSAILAAIQGPGSLHPRFSTKYYMMIMGILLSFPIFAYMHIVRNDLGLREEIICSDGYDKDFKNNEKISTATESSESTGSAGSSCGNVRYSHIRSDSDPSDHFESYEEDSMNPKLDINNMNQSKNALLDSTVIRSDSFIESSDKMNGKYENIRNPQDYTGNNRTSISNISNNNNVNNNNNCNSLNRKDYIDYIIPSSILKSNRYLRDALPMCMIIGFVNMNTWGIVTALAPFAFQNVSSAGEGSSMLGYAYETGAVCLMLGDLSTTACHIPSRYALILFTFFTSTIYISAMHLITVDSSIAAPLIVLFFALGRFFEAHLVTSAYRKIASDFHPLDRENAARAVGISDQLSTTLGSIMSSLLVARYAAC